VSEGYITAQYTEVSYTDVRALSIQSLYCITRCDFCVDIADMGIEGVSCSDVYSSRCASPAAGQYYKPLGQWLAKVTSVV
jgi:hypothetical protein